MDDPYEGTLVKIRAGYDGPWQQYLVIRRSNTAPDEVTFDLLADPEGPSIEEQITPAED